MKKLAGILMAIFMIAELPAQDSLDQKNSRPLRRHELGLSITTPIIILFGGQDQSGRYNNLTYRYWVTKNHAARLIVGANFNEDTDPYTQPYNSGIIPTLDPLVYQTKTKTTPSNYQFGFGYEYMMGNKWKHGPGIDIMYNYLLEKDEFYHMKVYQTIDANGGREDHFDRLDSAAFVQTRTINKYGVNLGYSLRYEPSRRWVITASASAALRISVIGSGPNAIQNLDFNMPGLISDLSLFYRF